MDRITAQLLDAISAKAAQMGLVGVGLAMVVRAAAGERLEDAYAARSGVVHSVVCGGRFYCEKGELWPDSPYVTNFFGVAAQKLAKCLATGQDSQIDPEGRALKGGEVSYGGGRVVRLKDGYLVAAYSGGRNGDEDIQLLNAVLAEGGFMDM